MSERLCPECGSGPEVWARIKKAVLHDRRVMLSKGDVIALERWFERQRCHRDAYLDALVKVSAELGATITIKLPERIVTTEPAAKEGSAK